VYCQLIFLNGRLKLFTKYCDEIEVVQMVSGGKTWGIEATWKTEVYMGG
jgi:hypothetical protein